MKRRSDNKTGKRRTLFPRAAAVLLSCAIFAWTPCVGVDAKTAYDSIASQEEWEVVKLVNKERYKGGKEGLTIFAKLQSAADVRAKEIRTVFSHSRPDGTSCFTVLNEKGIFYMSAGENIANGMSTPQAVMDAWMSSEGHRANIMSENYEFDHIGVGYVTGGPNKKNWTQYFIGGCWTTAIKVNSVSDASYEKGTTIDDMDRYLIVTCQEHGTSYMPITAAMCKGYKPSRTGTQTIKVTYHGLTTSFTVRIGSGAAAESGEVQKPGKVKKVTVKKTGSGKVKVSFGKTSCDGYEIYMKTGSGSYKKKKTIKKATAFSYTVKNLKKKQTYSFKVRAYRNSDAGKVYGSFSAAAKIKL